MDRIREYKIREELKIKQINQTLEENKLARINEEMSIKRLWEAKLQGTKRR